MNTKKSKAVWERNIIFYIVLGYATYHIVRQNFNIIFANKDFIESFNYLYFGWAFTVNSVIYGTGKIFNGYIGDRCSSRKFFCLGLFISGILSVISSFQDNILYVVLVFVLNSWFQSMGFPAIAKLIMNWTEKSKIGSRWSLITTSNQIGGITIVVLGSFILENFGWKKTFFISGSFAIIISIVLYHLLRDSYCKVNPNFDKATLSSSPSPLRLIIKKLFTSRELQILCLVSMLVYAIRIGILNWAPIFLVQHYKSSTVLMGMQIGIYEATGLLGCITIGYLIDRFFNKYLGQLGAFSMLLFISLFYLLSILEKDQKILSFVLLGIIGFILYIPQILIGIISTKISDKNDIGVINGIIGFSGYLGSGVSGVGNAIVIENYGWEGSFIFFIIIGIISFLVFWTMSLSVNKFNKPILLKQNNLLI